jgi:hypothetical protein
MYLEFFIAGLTGFFLWLLIHHVRAFHRERKRQQAGQVVLEVKPSRWALLFAYVSLSFYYFAFLAILWMHISATFRGSKHWVLGIDVESLPFVWVNIDCFLGTFFLCGYLSLICHRWIDIVIYEHGIQIGARFTPWEKVVYCQWHPSNKKRLGIVTSRFVIKPKYYHFIRDHDSMASALCRFAEIRDKDGTVISTPPDHSSPDRPDRKTKKRPSRSFPLQFDLLTLFLLMLFIASASSWYGYHFARSKPQRDAIAKLAKHQPDVSYYDVDVKSLVIYASKSGSQGDVDLTAVESLPAIQILLLQSPSITDADLVHLESAIHLKSLCLRDTAVTGSGFSRLERLTQLQNLTLYGSPVSDDYLAQLQAFPLLQRLNLGKTKITDAGLRHLSAMPGLVSLWLEETNITDSGLKELSSLRQLQYLYLSKTNITDAGLSHLSAMPKLFDLWLDGTNITDSGLKELSSCRQLRRLELSGTNITDAGVEYLKELPLGYLNISGTKITQKVLEELRNALPNADIVFSPVTPSPGVSPADESSAPTEEN